MVSSIAPRAAQALLLLALGCLAPASWLGTAEDALLIIGVTALLVAPWLSLLSPGGSDRAAWPWIAALLALAVVAFLL